jgi:hypothetical protein
VVQESCDRQLDDLDLRFARAGFRDPRDGGAPGPSSRIVAVAGP